MACRSLAHSAADAVPASPWARCGNCRCSLDRHGFRGRVPRRGGRPSHGRAVWHARAGGRGDRDRGGADRFRHDCSSDGKGGASPRHGVRRCDDCLQRDRRTLPAVGRRPPSRTGVSGPWGECCIGHIGSAHDSHAHFAERRNNRTGAVFQHVPARVCWSHSLCCFMALLYSFRPYATATTSYQ